MTDKIYGMLGLAVRAGKIVFGSEAGSDAVRNQKAYLVILAEDASDRTKKLMNNKCKSFNVPIFEYGTIIDLGTKLGKKKVSCVALVDKGFAEVIIRKLN